MNYHVNDVYYFQNLNSIGGVESHLYYLAKKYGDRDWVIVIETGNIKQIARLNKLVPVIILKPEDTIECNNFFFTYQCQILNKVKYKKLVFVSHANYEDQMKQGTMAQGTVEKIKSVNPEIYAVSHTANRLFNGKIVGMPIELDNFEDPILLVSATRLTAEKGFDRMVKLAQMLDDAKVNYLWHVYTNSDKTIDSPNVQFLPPRLDIVSKFPLYDGLVQLSDSEAFCIAMQEALLCGLPLIATPLPVLAEDFKLDDRSVITFPFDMTDSGQIERIRNIKSMKIPKYKVPSDKWDQLLTGKQSFKSNLKIYLVKANNVSQERTIELSELGRVAKPGEVFETTRLENLVYGKNPFNTPFAELIGEL